MASLFSSKKLIVYCKDGQKLSQDQKIILLNLIVDHKIDFFLTEKQITGYEMITEVHKEVNHLSFRIDRSPTMNIKNKLKFHKEFKDDFSKNILIVCSQETIKSCSIELRNKEILNKIEKDKIFLFYKDKKQFYAEEIKAEIPYSLQPVNGFEEIAESVTDKRFY